MLRAHDTGETWTCYLKELRAVKCEHGERRLVLEEAEADAMTRFDIWDT